jgi:peroxiredoxin
MPYNLELIKEKNLSFDIFSDPGNKLAHSYGLVYTLPPDLREVYLKFGIDLPLYNGDDSWELPMPARFIIDQEGIIRYAEYDPDYTTRPEPEHTLEALKQLAAKPAANTEDPENTQKAEEA